MTFSTDILGRQPIMRPIKRGDEAKPCDDWKGKAIMANIRRNTQGSVNFTTALSKHKPIPERTAPYRRKQGAVCAVEGCANILSPRNKMRVCNGHRHVDVCQCLPCQNKRERGLK